MNWLVFIYNVHSRIVRWARRNKNRIVLQESKAHPTCEMFAELFSNCLPASKVNVRHVTTKEALNFQRRLLRYVFVFDPLTLNKCSDQFAVRLSTNEQQSQKRHCSIREVSDPEWPCFHLSHSDG